MKTFGFVLCLVGVAVFGYGSHLLWNPEFPEMGVFLGGVAFLSALGSVIVALQK